ncbi:MAG: nitrophenyl compound nitroreductase subunit ArsF family protein, partial [Verrucomicrobiia bacterium]
CSFVPVTDARVVGCDPNQVATNATACTLIAYYFHGTVRCETCLLIETLARAVVEQQFYAEVAANRIIWESVNYDQPENQHFVADYNLPCPSLVLVLLQEGKPQDWKLLGDTWQLVHEPAKLNDYVETEVRSFLKGRGQPISSEQTGAPHIPEHQ